ncbi:putative U1 small nuclear ribonucleo protein A [Dimargaris cristalligena]|uniref:Putative U1 small nuclear ribonucleo protein A n=1 Tax=Dimargaris cristalligena TaxID=215637 RepID=A0A4Q0A4J4_9FUNG|nr:putative U1 small nuclear ribonucleo protein A [Dimargaris cristalligena]|eukprot:RKP40322.1 putative U1 small nuclear ribonucleo protein A [Dimargaris cristalligena]
MAINSPKETLYVHRLNEKVKKPELKRSLYALFSTYGRIVNIRAAKTSNLRGQAFIEFVDVGSATIAMQRLNGFIFYDLPLVSSIESNLD